MGGFKAKPKGRVSDPAWAEMFPFQHMQSCKAIWLDLWTCTCWFKTVDLPLKPTANKPNFKGVPGLRLGFQLQVSTPLPLLGFRGVRSPLEVVHFWQGVNPELRLILPFFRVSPAQPWESKSKDQPTSLPLLISHGQCFKTSNSRPFHIFLIAPKPGDSGNHVDAKQKPGRVGSRLVGMKSAKRASLLTNPRLTFHAFAKLVISCLVSRCGWVFSIGIEAGGRGGWFKHVAKDRHWMPKGRGCDSKGGVLDSQSASLEVAPAMRAAPLGTTGRYLNEGPTSLHVFNSPGNQ